CSRAQLEQSRAHLGGDVPAKVFLIALAHLKFDDDPALSHGHLSEAPEQNRLPAAASAPTDHRRPRAAPTEACAQWVEARQLIVPTHDSGGHRARVGCVRVADRIHGREFRKVTLVYPVSINLSNIDKGPPGRIVVAIHRCPCRPATTRSPPWRRSPRPQRCA